MKRLLVAVVIAVLILMVGSRAVTSARAPLVLAFYYDWYDENIWKPTQVPDMPVTRYTSRDPQAMARQIQQARGAGIDAFVVSWWGAGNPTDANFKVLLDQARAADFRVAIDFELTSPFYRSRDDAVKSLKNLLATHINHPAYLRVDGKPVIFFWRQNKYSVDTWKAIRDQVDPNHQTLWISEGVDTSYLQVFDGHHLYSVGWATSPAAEMQKYAGRVRGYGPDKIWVATTMPGNDDTRTGRATSYKRDRQGGDFYRQTWQGAVSSSPDWIIITSFNEWVEGTMIEPSVTYGDLYLNITREFALPFKAGAPPPPPKPTATRKPVPTATPAPTATLIPGGVRGSVTDIIRVRAEPSTDADILGRLREGANVVLLARSDDGKWYQMAYPDARRRGWIAADYTTVKGDGDALPVISSSPTPSVVIVPDEPSSADETVEAPIEELPPEEELAPEPTAEPASPPASTPAPLFSLPWLKDIFPFLH